LVSVGLLGFIGFVVNLLNRPTEGATVHVLKSTYEKVRPKKSYFLSASENVKLPFSLRVPKKVIVKLALHETMRNNYYFHVIVEKTVFLGVFLCEINFEKPSASTSNCQPITW
jgi:hypothetical protein